MPNIQFPDVPDYPGVPPLVRKANAEIAAVPDLAIAIGALENILGNALQQPIIWGIFDALGNQLGGSDSSGNGILAALQSQLTGSFAPTLSTLSFDFTRETRVSDFPIELGSFAAYNKVQNPATPSVVLGLSGSEADRTNFLNAMDAACISTNLYTVVTPEVQYVNYNIERYSVSRRADRGATMLVVEVFLTEIRQVSAIFTQSVKPITNPQAPGATSQTNNGLTQPAAPPQSTLLSLAQKLGISN